MSLREQLRKTAFTSSLAIICLTLLNLFSFCQRSDSAIRIGLPQDWSNRHVAFSPCTSVQALAAAQSDPRLFYGWLLRTRSWENRFNRESNSDTAYTSPRNNRRPHRDWSVSLGGAGTPALMFPAKYTFDVNSAPDCVNDFVVFPVNAPGSSAQANIVALNYLYSGTTPNNGICNNLAGNGTSAKVMWAYNVGNQGVATSPALSLDGTKVAFVQNQNPARFQVLAWSAGQGTVTAPATPTVVSTAPTAGTGQIATLTLPGATSDASSSPFVDYTNDVAYLGTDNGKVYRIKNVFCSTLACKNSPVAPSLDTSPWPVTAGNTNLTAPVFDGVSGNVFVGSRNGKLYGFTSAGTPLMGSPLSLGNGAAKGGFTDAPVVDSSGGFVFVSTGDNGSGNAITVQTNTFFSATRTAAIGTGNQTNIHLGSLNEAYFSQSANQIGTPSEWFWYVCGVAGAAGKTPMLYRIGFDVNRVMNTAPDATALSLSSNNNEECSPLTDFLNGVDRLYLSLLTSQQSKVFDISSSTTPTSGGAVAEAGGTSGIIIDNVSTQNQASNIYFSTLASSASCGNHLCAVKLTQSGLQ